MLGNLVTVVIYPLAFLTVITVIITIHELGHYFAARLCGVKIETASLGFGRAILAARDKRGVTWQLCWIPLGGYVKFAGDPNVTGVPDARDLQDMKEQIIAAEGPGAEKKYYHFKPVWQRAFIAVAGPVSNFVLAILIFATLFLTVGQEVQRPRIDQVLANSPAAAAGLQPGDLITRIDGRDIKTDRDAREMISLSSDTALTMVVDRAGKPVTIHVTPKRVSQKDPILGVQKLGVVGVLFDRHVYRLKSAGPLEALRDGAVTCWRMVSDTVTYIGRIFTGKESGDQLGGPIRTVQLAGNVTRAAVEGDGDAGFKALGVVVALASFIASISVAVGFLNLLPIPVLDGGHLLFYGYEAVARKPLGARVQTVGFQVGLALIVGLMLFATWNDLQRFDLFKIVGGLFS